MRIRSARHLSDAVLSLEIDDLCTNDRANCAQLLVHLAEFDRRKLYLPAGYPSMFRYCVHKCLMSEDVAYRRIRVARAARRHPGIVLAIDDGRLNLNTVILLAPYLSHAQAGDLLKGAEHQTRSAIELSIARAFPKADVPTQVTPIALAASPGTTLELAARPVFDICDEPASSVAAPRRAGEIAAGAGSVPPPRISPLAPDRFQLQTTIDRETQDDLIRAQELLGQVSKSQIPEVLSKALRLYVIHLERQKRAATDRPQEARRPNHDPRHIPSAVKRAVCRRDRDRCTFVSGSGHRCEERSGLEFDHIVPVARGGTATVGNIRLRCPGHNQLEADRTFGFQFMENKREAARERKREATSAARGAG